MMVTAARFLMLTGVVIGLSMAVAAQPPRGNSFGSRAAITRPTVSPYLNLFRGNGNSTAFNYYTQVRPQFDLRNNAGRLQGELNNLEREFANQSAQAIAPAEGGSLNRLPQTGHATSFNNTQGYFGTRR